MSICYIFRLNKKLKRKMHKDPEGVELKSSTREVTVQGPEQGKEASNWGMLRGRGGRCAEIGNR